MSCGKHQRPDVVPIQPMRQLAPDDATSCAPLPGDHLDASKSVGVRGLQEADERMERSLRSQPMQVQRPLRAHGSAAQPLPRRPIEAAGLRADRQHARCLTERSSPSRRLAFAGRFTSGRARHTPAQRFDPTGELRPGSSFLLTQATGLVHARTHNAGSVAAIR